jgi:hypothetical protein
VDPLIRQHARVQASSAPPTYPAILAAGAEEGRWGATIRVKAKHAGVMHEIYISFKASFGQEVRVWQHQKCCSVLPVTILL